MEGYRMSTPAPEKAPEQQPADKPDDDEQRDDEQPDEQQTDSQESHEQPWDAERAKAKIRKLNAENKGLRERANAAPKPEDVQQLAARNKELELTTLRLDVGYELGLPREIAQRLQGTTRDEMLADAEVLVDLVAPEKTRPPATRRPAEQQLRGGGTPDREPEETDLTKIGERMFRN